MGNTRHSRSRPQSHRKQHRLAPRQSPMPLQSSQFAPPQTCVRFLVALFWYRPLSFFASCLSLSSGLLINEFVRPSVRPVLRHVLHNYQSLGNADTFWIVSCITYRRTFRMGNSAASLQIWTKTHWEKFDEFWKREFSRLNWKSIFKVRVCSGRCSVNRAECLWNSETKNNEGDL